MAGLQSRVWRDSDFQLKSYYFQFPPKSVKKSQANNVECKNIARMFSCKVQIYVFIYSAENESIRIYSAYSIQGIVFFFFQDLKIGSNNGCSPHSALCART